MNKSGTFQKIFILAAFLCVLLATGFVSAEEEVTYYAPITEVSLGIKELTLMPGQQFTLPLTHKPAETPTVFLEWYTDESTIHLEPETHTVTAVAPGKTRLLVEDVFGFTYDYCDITVAGSYPKDAWEKKSSSEIIMLSKVDRSRIKAETVKHYLEFIDASTFTPEAAAALLERDFNVTADVKPGTITAQSKRALALGMDKALELPDFDAVSLHGTLDQILAFVRDNDELIRVFEFAPLAIDEPVREEDSELAAKAVNLGELVEPLTLVSQAHKFGLTGAGTTIAVIDSGLNSQHDQFKGRVVAEKCAAQGTFTKHSLCEAGSSAPSKSEDQTQEDISHGAHVTGIAAGRDGIAPGAKIISINTAVESCNIFTKQCTVTNKFDFYEVAQYLADLQKKYKEAGYPIVAVNMSMGEEKHPDTCDEAKGDIKKAFDLLLENDIIPVVSSGNDGYEGAVSYPACLSNAFTVGALYNTKTPKIAPFSNHDEKMVDILAPGTYIYSAFYTCEDGSVSTNCYGWLSGTSQAAPMVTGAFAILKQAYPSLNADGLQKAIIQLSERSGRTADYRPEGSLWKSELTNPKKTFTYSKPILDFSEINRTGTCGTNVQYVMKGNTIRFEKEIPSLDAVWGLDCRDAINSYSAITEVTIAEQIRVLDARYSFGNLQYVEKMNLSKLDVSQVRDMQSMFDGCSHLTSLDLSGWNTSNVTEMAFMFEHCSSLTSLDLSGWVTSNVTSMPDMFGYCNSLTSLDLRGWDTSNVTNMVFMFEYCSSLTSLDLSSWDTSKVKWIKNMFYGCESLNTLILGKNTLKTNIFYKNDEMDWKLPKYSDTWYYFAPGDDAIDPLPNESVKKDGTLFTKYDYRTMAGTWMAGKQVLLIINFVSRCYRYILGREADQSGRAYYANQLQQGKLTGAQMVMNFVNSPEFQGKKYSNEKVVEILYQTMMDRTADAGGRTYWAAFLNDGMSQKYIVRGFAGSKEFKNICSTYGITPGTVALTENRDKNPKVTAFVSRNYSIALGRKGDVNGLNYWCGKILDKSLTPQQVANSFVFSKECVNKNLSDMDFVKMLYNLYMGRNFDQGGLNFWLQQMSSGMSRQTVAKSFGGSKEFREIVNSYGL